jgi:hypothetical protein
MLYKQKGGNGSTYEKSVIFNGSKQRLSETKMMCGCVRALYTQPCGFHTSNDRV